MAAIVFNPYCIPVIISAVSCLLLAVFVKRRSDTRAATHLFFLLILAVIWCVSYAVELCFVEATQKLMAIKFQYISIPSVPVLFAHFVYRYANPSAKQINLRLTCLSFLIPAAATLLMCTNGWHHIMYNGWSITQIPNTLYTFLIPDYGIGFIISTVYSYFITIATFIYIIYVSVKTTKFFSAQAIVLFSCAIVPIIANTMYFFTTSPYIYLDLTPIAFLFSAVLMTYLVTGMKLYDLQPLARDLIIEKTTDGTILLDSYHNILDLNPMAEKIFNVQKFKMLKKNIKTFFNELPQDEPKNNYEKEFKLNGKIYQLYAMALHNNSGAYEGQILVFRDITATKFAENRIKYLAYTNLLTGLPNHVHMLQRLKKMLACSEHDTRLAVLLIDINDLSHINSSFGYDMGDALIKKVANLIKPNISEDDIFAHMKGDEFLIAMVSDNLEVSARSLAKRITGLFIHPIKINDTSISAMVNIGICLLSDETDANKLIQKASLALGQAKKSKEHYAFYSPQKDHEIAERNKLLNALYTALDNNEFSLVYQPQYDYHTNSLCGVEALLRWRHPKLGNVPPIKFIHLLEDSGIIIPVGNWVITEAAKQLSRWNQNGLHIPKCCINISVKQFDNDDLLAHIINTLDNEGVPRHCFEVEITETLAAVANNDVVKKIGALSSAGIRLAIDDFGAGFSSLTYFKYLNINTLKIDKEISIDIHKNKYSTVIFESLKHVCDALGVDIITEYVESYEQIEKLLSLGCHNFQGNYYSEPLTPDDLEKYVTSLHD